MNGKSADSAIIRRTLNGSTIRNRLHRALSILVMLCLAGGIFIFAVNLHIRSSAAPYILDRQTALSADLLPNTDCIMVLGCGVNSDGTPRLLLRDRLDCGAALYLNGEAPKLLMSGDHGRVGYDEVNGMKNYAIEYGIPSSDVFMDHAGFSTYESMYRARDVFDVDSLIIVTQEYHLYRAVYTARSLGLDAYGVSCDPGEYYNQIWLDAREVLARAKDFLYCIFKPEPTFLGEVIPISGNGDLTAG